MMNHRSLLLPATELAASLRFYHFYHLSSFKNSGKCWKFPLTCNLWQGHPWATAEDVLLGTLRGWEVEAQSLCAAELSEAVVGPRASKDAGQEPEERSGLTAAPTLRSSHCRFPRLLPGSTTVELWCLLTEKSQG